MCQSPNFVDKKGKHKQVEQHMQNHSAARAEEKVSNALTVASGHLLSPSMFSSVHRHFILKKIITRGIC